MNNMNYNPFRRNNMSGIQPVKLYNNKELPATIKNDNKYQEDTWNDVPEDAKIRLKKFTFIGTCIVCKWRFRHYLERKTCSRKCKNIYAGQQISARY